ncbi:primosome assembly protein PriA [Intrasporangium oryzae NRRL B-24470]|uniref:Probable replication restart protein PriA n=1 Tax=Intrasporangium oryzae NRRL B-24470 TaxID=1386089 RepID=W9GCH5_9MICO|nr:primosomal protein N' [Intrasporangium oryzae]EWT02932.1 primosome assembly protein PriA [Intrasporangium oryzae NRRL B-24470]
MGETTTARRPEHDQVTGPVAAVVVETPLAHLDRVFEYDVPDELAADAVPGARVRVRFAGRELDGFVVERRERAEHDGRLQPLRRVVSPEPVLTPEVLGLCRSVADRYAGTLSDVLRLAVPRRHATAERNLPLEPSPRAEVPAPEPGPWAAYPAGPAWLRRVASGEAPAAAWTALPGQVPGDDWPDALAVAAATALAGGRGSVIVVPDHRDVARLETALTRLLGPGQHVRLTADQGPQARYTAWLKVLRGHVRIVIGTRAAAFAPVHDLGLVAWWDDGDDLLAEPRAPYHHTGVVLGLRAEATGAAVLSGGFVRSLAIQVEVEAGRLVPVEADAAVVRAAAPRVSVAGEGLDEERDGAASRAHIPSRAWRVAKDALHDGPVLLQVPRRGYQPALSCAECRTPVRCSRCQGPVAVGASGRVPACRWCATTLGPDSFECRHCGARRLRSSVTGARRTAEEIGRAFPGYPVHTSGSGEVLAQVGSEPSLVVATPGAEPVAEGGYAAVLLLDAWASLDLPVLDAPLESLRRWAAAAALARSGRAVVLCGAPEAVTLPAIEALVRWDPAWLAARELADRTELGLPPAVRMAQLTGTRRGLQDALAQLDLPDGAQLLGPMPLPAPRRTGDGPAESRVDRHALVRIAPDRTGELTRALMALRAFRSARKEPEVVGVRVDPLDAF